MSRCLLCVVRGPLVRVSPPPPHTPVQVLPSRRRVPEVPQPCVAADCGVHRGGAGVPGRRLRAVQEAGALGLPVHRRGLLPGSVCSKMGAPGAVCSWGARRVAVGKQSLSRRCVPLRPPPPVKGARVGCSIASGVCALCVWALRCLGACVCRFWPYSPTRRWTGRRP